MPMDWLSSDYMETPTDMHATTEKLFLLARVKGLSAGRSLKLSSIVGYVPDGKDVIRGHVKILYQATTSEDQEVGMRWPPTWELVSCEEKT
jgi:hypothetical protein